MESDDMNVQKQRKIIMKVNGEKKEIVFNDKDKGSGSKRKSSDRSASPTKRKKSSESSSSSSKHKLIDELSTVLKNIAKEASSSGLSKYEQSEKSTSSDKKNSSSHKSSSSTKNNSSSATSKSKSSSEHKSSKVSSSDDKSALLLEENESEKHKSSKKSDSKSKFSENSVNKSELKTPESSSHKHKSSEKSKEHSSDQSSASEIKHKSSSSTSKSKSSSEHKSSEKLSSDDKSALVSELKESEKHKSSKKSDSKSKSSEKSSSVNKSEQQAPESSSQKHKSSDKSKERPSVQSSASEIKNKSSSSTSKSKSSEKSSSSSKRSRSSEKSSSSQSKQRKSSDETKNESKERKSETDTPNDLVIKEIQSMREKYENILKELVENFKIETKKVMEELRKGGVVRDLPSIESSLVNLPDFDEETQIVEKLKKQLAFLNALRIDNYPNEDYGYILDINGLCIPKCRSKYFTDSKDNVLKFRNIADISHVVEKPPEGQNDKDYEAGCCSTSKIDKNAAPEEKVENDATLVPNTEIPLHEIIGLTDSQQIMTNENIKVVSIKSEIIEDEILTKPINLFVPSTPSVDNQCLPDSKLNIRLKNIKSEPQPHCSKDIPTINVKQEFSIDSKEYFRIIPQKFVNSEIPAVENSEKSETLEDMSVINKWIGSQNKNYGFKDKETLYSMMSRDSLFSLFKCMGINCCYTTISYENFLEHLNIHKESNSSIKDCFLNCAYCLDKSEDPIDLFEHYKNTHHNCIYQCSLCFYRSAEQQSVYDHQAYYHSNDTRRQILECPNVFPRDEKAEEYKARKMVENIKECLKCDFCPKMFIIPEDYIKHLKSCHQSVEEKNKSEELIKQMNINFANNRIGKYQCLECGYGSNNKIEIRTHLHQHPSKLHFVCVRESDQYKLMRLKSRGDIQVRKYNGDLEVLKNTEGI